MTEKILISQIIITDRMRQDLGDLTDLKESLEEHGLLQAIGVRMESDRTFRLIWGGRRTQAATELGWTEIEAKVLDCEEDYDLREKELEENVRRKDMTWQEQACTMYEIHRLKTMRNAMVGEKWGFRDTGRLLGISLGNVAYTLEVAKCLRAGDQAIKESSSMTDALRILIKRKEGELQSRKLATTKAESGTSFFSADDLKGLQEVKTEDKKVEMHLNHSSSIPLNTRLIVADVINPDLLAYVTRSKDCYLLFRFDPMSDIDRGCLEGIDQIGLNGGDLICFKDESVTTANTPFRHQLCLFGLWYGQDFKAFKNTNLPAVLTGNNFINRQAHGPWAMDERFWQHIFTNLLQPKDHVYFYQPKSTDGMWKAGAEGYQVWTDDAEALSITKQKLEPYGSVN